MLIALSNGHLSARLKFAWTPVRIHTLTSYFILHRVPKVGPTVLIGNYDRDMVELTIHNEMEAASKDSNLRILK